MRRDPLFGVLVPETGWSPPIRYLLRRARVLRLLRQVPPARLVEVGCGGGALLDDLACAGWSATGVESSPGALAMARGIRDRSGGAQRLLDAPDPGWHQCFDWLLALDVLEHIEDDGAALAAWRNWLAPEGHLLLSVPAHRRNWGPGDEWAGHYRRYDRADIEALVRASGFDLVYLECYGFPAANIIDAVAQGVYRRMIAARSHGTTQAAATAASGVERGAVGRWFPWLDSLPGRQLLRLAIWIQGLAARRDWGNGYLLLARSRR